MLSRRRRLTRTLGSRRLWRLRLVFLGGAICVGLVSIFFAKAADLAQGGFARLAGEVPLLPLLVTPLGFALSIYLSRRFFPNSGGSGIPQAMAARALQRRSERARLLSLRVAAGKIALTLLGLLCGGSVGREGPTVQVGAAIMLEVARLGRLRNAGGLILAGSAAGVAAAFNTPLAGIVFAIEEMSRAFETRAHSLVLMTVIVGGIVSLGLVGDYAYFGETSAVAAGAADWVLVAACGVFGGLFGGLFSRALLEGTRALRRWCAPAPLARSVLFAALCGLLAAVLGILTGGATFGTGYEAARGAVEGQALGWSYFPAKFAASLATALSGIPGGIFAPSLSVGAGLGSLLSGLVSSQSASLAAVLGMAGYFAGVVQAPMTAFVIILEMTRGEANVIPLMIAAFLGYGVSRLVAPEPLYHGLAHDFQAAVEADRQDLRR